MLRILASVCCPIISTVSQSYLSINNLDHLPREITSCDDVCILSPERVRSFTVGSCRRDTANGSEWTKRGDSERAQAAGKVKLERSAREVSRLPSPTWVRRFSNRDKTSTCELLETRVCPTIRNSATRFRHRSANAVCWLSTLSLIPQTRYLSLNEIYLF